MIPAERQAHGAHTAPFNRSMGWRADSVGIEGPFFNQDVPYAANKAVTRVLTKVCQRCGISRLGLASFF